MRASLLGVATLPLLAHSANIILSNDDGWAELNIRAFYNALKAAGNKVVVSAPAQDRSGTASADLPPIPLILHACEFDSCPRGSPPTGFNSSDPNLNYVNSFPVTSIKYGIKTLAPKLLGSAPEIAVAGPNVGGNAGILTEFSGTVGAATEAAKEGIPAIAFSGATGDQTAWNAPAPPYVGIYADLSVNITETLLASGKPYLPNNTWLNVNYPAVTDTTCTDAKAFKFVLSRIFPAIPIITSADVEACGSKRLPTEADVLETMGGCYASISVGEAGDKTDGGEAEQAAVLAKLGGLLTCLPK